MSMEKNKLLGMLNAGKISPEEFETLSAAIDNNNLHVFSLFSIINPFQKIAGGHALIAGLIIMLAMSFLGVIAKVYFPGILDILNAVVIKNPKVPLNFFLLLSQNIICWFLLSILFIAAAKIFRQKGTRVIDFFGTVALSRYPYLLLTLFISILQIINPNFMNIDLSKGVQFHLSFMTVLFLFIAITCVIWQITTYFYALKESSGLLGKRLWISFIVCIVFGEIISSLLTTTIM